MHLILFQADNRPPPEAYDPSVYHFGPWHVLWNLFFGGGSLLYLGGNGVYVIERTEVAENTPGNCNFGCQP